METRWAIIAEDGRHTWLGRASDPVEKELEAAAEALDAKAVVAWLAVVRGDYWSPRAEPEVMVVRLLTRKAGDQDRAVAAWRTTRVATLAG